MFTALYKRTYRYSRPYVHACVRQQTIIEIMKGTQFTIRTNYFLRLSNTHSHCHNPVTLHGRLSLLSPSKFNLLFCL